MISAGGDRAGRETPCRFDRPYLLALNVGLRSHDGLYWADASWAKDLAKHAAYLPRLTLFCPIEQGAPPAGWQALDPDAFQIEGYAAPASGKAFLLALPHILARLWRLIGQAELVHSGIAGWPLPLGWFAAPIARLRARKLAIIVESAFWRLPEGAPAGPARRLRSALWEAAARACLAMADHAAYTQPEYRRSLPSPRASGGRLIQASWVDEGDCLDPAAAEAAWEARRTRPRRFLFAARMIAEKGTAILAEAFAHLAREEAPLFIDIIGEGPERDVLAAAADTPWGRTHVGFLAAVPYGPAFFAALHPYHALLAPGLSDEQPRIVYDGYSQGIATIGSDLPGLRACVGDGATGRLVPAGDSAALAAAMRDTEMATFESWGIAGLARVRGITHEELHRQRCRDLNALFEVQ